MEDYRAMIEKAHQMALDRILHNKHILFDLFDAHKIIGAEVSFDGSGDNGSIQDVNLDTPKGVKQEVVENIMVEGVKIYQSRSFSKDEGWQENVSDKPVTLRELIESISYDALMSKHEGWENNGGAYGTLYFDSKTRTINLEHNARSIECFEYEF